MPIPRKTGECCGSERQQLKAHLGRLSALTKRQLLNNRLLMRDKYYADGMTQQEIANVLGVSRCAVQQMERNIIRKIQRHFEKHGIKKEDYLEEMNDIKRFSKTGNKKDTASSNDGRSNDNSVVEAKDHQGTGNNL